MANKFGSDILITATTPMIGLHGNHINLFIERGPALGPVLEVTVDNVPRTYVRIPTV